MSLKKSKSDPALDTGSTAEQTPAAADASTPEERRSTRTKGTMDARRTEKKLSRNKLMTKGAFLTAAAVILLMAILFAASALLNFEGSFTIKLVSPQSGGKAIALSETMGFANPVVKLEAMPINEMDNITYDWLPLDELDRHDGSYNGENYIAYTFYIRNAGVEVLDYSATLNVTACTLNVDRAVRVMVYRNGEPTIYAVEREDGSTEPVPEGVVNFQSPTTVFEDIRTGFPTTGMDKWTVIVWLEGEDPECVDNVRGGTMKLELDIDIMSGENEENVTEEEAG